MTEYKFKIDDRVVYGTNGLCTIEGIEMLSFATGLPENPYYVLRPDSNDSSTVYVPLKNEKLVAKMRKVLTVEDVEELVLSSRDEELEWDNDRRFRNENFHEILVNGVTKDLLLMIRCIHMRRDKLEEVGKKLPTTDSNILKQAQKLVDEEFSHVLGIAPKDVENYIKGLLGVE